MTATLNFSTPPRLLTLVGMFAATLTLAACAEGPVGPEGEQGPAGPQGAAGADGPAGPPLGTTTVNCPKADVHSDLVTKVDLTYSNLCVYKVGVGAADHHSGQGVCMNEGYQGLCTYDQLERACLKGYEVSDGYWLGDTVGTNQVMVTNSSNCAGFAVAVDRSAAAPKSYICCAEYPVYPE